MTDPAAVHRCGTVCIIKFWNLGPINVQIAQNHIPGPFCPWDKDQPKHVQFSLISFMVPGKQTCCVGQSAHLSYFSFPDVAVSHSYCSGSNVCVAEGMLPRVYSTIDVETEKNCKNGFHFTISCWFIPGSLAKSFTSCGTLKQAPYCRMRSDMWFDHFNKGLVQCRSAQGHGRGGPRLICAAIYFDIATCRWEIVKNHEEKCLLSQATRYEDFFMKA